MPSSQVRLFRRAARIGAALLALSAVCSAAFATPLLSDTHTIAVSSAATPVEHEIQISTPGAYQVTLTDLAAAYPTPAPLQSAALAVTTGSTLVGTPITAPGTLNFNATAAGTYIVHVTGVPGDVTKGSGAIGIAVTGGNLQGQTFSDSLTVPQQPVPSSVGVLLDTFTVTSSGSYTVTLTDMQLPQSLTTLTLAVTTQQAPVAILPQPGGATTTTVALQSGESYSVFAIGVTSASAIGGLYNVSVGPAGGGAPVYTKTKAIGGVLDLGPITTSQGESYSLKLSDLAFPAALTQVGAVVVQNSTIGASLSAAGSQSFTATATQYEVFSLATAAATPGVGSYSVQVLPATGAPLLSVARAVTLSGNTSTAYSFDTSVVASGAYVAGLQNFSFPAPLTSVSLAASQGGALVGALLNGTGTLNLNLAAGPVTLLVVAQANSRSGGIFDVNLASAASSKALFDVTQGVGTYFVARKFTVTTAGSYDVTASDIGFPAPFSKFAVMASQGTQMFGSIFTTGKFSFNATPGDYYVNFLAQPAVAGTYAIAVAPTPSAPTVTLTASASSVAQGGTVTLNWSAQNATSCAASGGWSGTQALTGPFTTAGLTTTTTFTITCSGSGQSVTSSVTVTVNPPASSGGGGGGGSVDLLSVLLLGGLVGSYRARRPQSV